MARIVCVVVLVCTAVMPASAQEAAVQQAPVKRPAVLVPLYVSSVALQGIDCVTTMKAIGSGAGREANPAMQPLVGNSAAFVAVKAGSAAATVWLAERIRKRNRVASVALMIGVNAGMAVVVGHNLRVR